MASVTSLPSQFPTLTLHHRVAGERCRTSSSFKTDLSAYQKRPMQPFHCEARVHCLQSKELTGYPTAGAGSSGVPLLRRPLALHRSVARLLWLLSTSLPLYLSPLYLSTSLSARHLPALQLPLFLPSLPLPLYLSRCVRRGCSLTCFSTPIPLYLSTSLPLPLYLSHVHLSPLSTARPLPLCAAHAALYLST